MCRKIKKRRKEGRTEGARTETFPAGGRRLYVIATGQSLKSRKGGGRECFAPLPPLRQNRLLGMCYLDVATDAEALPLGGEERVGHLLRGGLDLLLDLLLGDTLIIIITSKERKGDENEDQTHDGPDGRREVGMISYTSYT